MLHPYIACLARGRQKVLAKRENILFYLTDKTSQGGKPFQMYYVNLYLPQCQIQYAPNLTPPPPPLGGTFV